MKKIKPIISFLSAFLILFTSIGLPTFANEEIETTVEETVEALPQETYDDAQTLEEDIPIVKSQSLNLKNLRANSVGTTTDPTIVEIRTLSDQVIYGGDWQGDKYVKTTKAAANGQRFVFRVNYAISGLYELDPGEIELRIPKSILRDRNGNLSDIYEMSVPTKAEVEDPNEEIDRDMNYAYYEDGDELVIYNFREVKAGENGYFEIAYATDKQTFQYKDMGKSDDFYANMKVVSSDDATGKTATATAEADKIPVYIDTTAKIESQKKENTGFYKTWQSAWGEKPADADEYWYFQWSVNTKIATATQPYDFTLADMPVTEDMEPVLYKFSGGQWTTENTVKNQTTTTSRTDNVVTRVPKANYQDLLKWTVTNKSEGTVTPVDKIDPQTKASAQAIYNYVYQDMRFTRPPGLGDGLPGGINYAKRADGAYRYYDGKAGGPSSKTSEWGPVINHWFTNLGMNAGYYTRYDLEDFRDGEITYFDGFDYEMISLGAFYLWTAPQGSDLDNPESYGKNKVTVSLIDDQFWLGDIQGDEGRQKEVNTRDTTGLYRLTSDDFEISFLRFDVTSRDAMYDVENMKFVSTVPEGMGADETVELWVKQGKVDDWKLAGTLNRATGNIDYNSTYVKSWVGDRVDFQSDIVAYKINTSGIHYSTQIRAVPNIALKNSDYVINFIQDKEEIFIYNESTHQWLRADGSLIAEFHEGDDDYACLSENARHSEIRKKVVSSSNDVKKKMYTITWSVEMQEYLALSESNKEYIEQNGGVFYDLLPAGSNPVVESVSVHNGKNYIDDNSFSVETISNYNNTGRTLLVVRINEKGYGPNHNFKVYFDTKHSWDSIKDFGNDVYNPVAYQTGNNKLTDGTADDGGTIQEKDLLKNLDSENGDAKRFIYSEREFDIVAITSAASGLRKKVKDDEDPAYVYDTWTQINSDYSYELRWANTFLNKSRDLILFDSLENYKENGTRPSDWKGTLTGIDLNQLKEKGIAPVVYLSRTENLDLEVHNDVSDTSVWTKLEDFGNINDARAIAIDMRKAEDGSVFVLDAGESVTAQLYMKAPSISPDIPEETGYPWAYNNIYIHNILIDDLGTEEEFYIHQDHTTIALIVANTLKIHKVNEENPTEDVSGVKFRLYGTSDYGTSVDKILTTDRLGNVTFKEIEKGTYTLEETYAPADWLMDKEAHKVEVKEDGSLWFDGRQIPDGIAYEYTNKPRVHADFGIIKKREETEAAAGVVVPNTSFKLEGVSFYGNEILEMGTTDASGRLYFRNIEQGNYTLKETKANDNYILNETVWNVKIDDTGAVNITADEDNKDRLWEVERNNNIFTVLNEGRYWSFVLWKIDADNESIYLQGAEYQLTGISDLNTEVNETKTTDEYGKIAFTHLEKGTYLLKETKAPQGVNEQGKTGGNRNYIADPSQYIVKIDEKGKVTIDGLDTNAEGDFVAKNTRALDGRITVIKKWNDGLTNEDNRPIPKLHLITKEPEGLTRFSVIYTAGDGNFNGKKTNTVTYEPTKMLEVGDTIDGPIVNGEIIEPTLDGYKFVGWYVDKELTKKYDPTKYYGKDVKIYPKWEKKPDWVVVDRSKWKNFDNYKSITSVVEDKNVNKNDVLSKDGVQRVDDESTEYEMYAWIENEEYHYWTNANIVKAPKDHNGMDTMFSGCSFLTDISPLSNWDTSDLLSMSFMFNECSSLTDISALSNWDTSRLMDVDGMFYNCSSLTDISALSNWDTSRLIRMRYIFDGCRFLTDISALSNWNINSVTDMYYLFGHCSSLTSIDLSSWNPSNVTDMDGMFSGCSSLTSIDLSSWNTSNVMNMASMFWNCRSLQNIYVSEKWNTNNVNDSRAMFYSCSSLPNFNSSVTDKTNAHYGPGGYLTYKSAPTANATDKANPLNSLLTSVKNAVVGEEVMAAIVDWTDYTWNDSSIKWMIDNDGCLHITPIDGEIGIYNNAGPSDSNVSMGDGMPWYDHRNEIKSIKTDGKKIKCYGPVFPLFCDLPNLTSIEFENFDVSEVTNFSSVFSEDSSLTDITGLASWNVDNVQSTYRMFHNCSSLTDISVLSNWDMSSVTSMSDMFYKCSSLTDISALSNWDMSSVTDMSWMFKDCSSLTDISALSNWDTSGVIDMDRMFDSCSSLTDVSGLSNWDTSGVSDMYRMFYNCSSLTDIDLSNWDTGSMYDMGYMFDGCSSLQKIKLPNMFHDNITPTSYPKSYVHKYDFNGNPTYDTKVYASGEMTSLKSTTTPSIGGTWVVPGYIEHIDLGDGDYEYISEDALWEKLDDNTWKYTFEVFDDTIPYWLYEEYISGYFSNAMAPNTIRVNVDEVTKTATIENYKPQDSGNLKISKTASGTGEKFDFTIKLTGDKISGVQVFSDIIFTDGIGKIKLGNNESITIEGLPTGTSYEVTENLRGDYTSTGNNTTGIITKDNTSNVSFTNTPVTKENPPVKVTLKKTTSGQFETDNTYHFFMEFTGLNANKTYTLSNGTAFKANASGEGETEVDLKANEEVSLDIPVGATYRFLEAAGDWFASYTVTDANNKNKIASSAGTNTEKDTEIFTALETADDGENVTVIFNNRLEQNQKIKITKEETGIKTGDSFNFILYFDNLTPFSSFNSNVGKIIADEDGTATKEFYLKDGEEVEIEELPVGTRFMVTEQKNKSNITYEVVGNTVVKATDNVERNNDLSTAMETIDLNEDNIVNFKNECIAGDLKLSKAVTGTLKDTDKNDEFEFDITLTPALNDTFSDVKFTNGKATVKLKKDESKTIEGIPAGTTYTIEEKSRTDYRIESAIGNTGEIEPGEVSDVSFTNHAIKYGNLKVEKKLAGEVLDANKEFEFTITLEDKTVNGKFGDITFTNGVANIKLKGGASQIAANLPITGYTITEKDYSSEGFKTTKSGDTGNIVADETQTATFTNERLTGELEVSKTVTGTKKAIDKDDLFEFIITLSVKLNNTYSDVEFKDGVATIKLKDGETKTISGLPAAIKFAIEEQQRADYSLENKTGDSGDIVANDKQSSSFTNLIEKYGDLEVSKTISGDGVTEADRNRKYQITVELSDKTINGTFGDMEFANGVATLNLAPGEKATAVSIPKNITYEITEADYTTFGFEPVYTNKTGTIPVNDKTKASVDNKKTTGNLEIEKVLTGQKKEVDTSKKFEFTITLSNKEYNETLSGVTFTNGVAKVNLADAEKKLIENIPTGITYTITEEDYTPDYVIEEKTNDTGDIKANETISSKWTNRVEKYGDVKVEKVITGALNDYDRSKAFNITVTLSDKTINGTFGDMTFKNGVAKIALKGGETATATGLPKNTKYTVTEDKYTHFGFATDIQGNSEIVPNTEKEVTVTNDKTVGNLSISKSLTGWIKDVDRQKEFKYTITLSNKEISGTFGDITFKDGIATTTLKDGEVKEATALPTGITYTVVEDDYTSEKYILEKKENDKGPIIKDTTSEAKFTNRVEKYGSLRVKKEVEGALQDEFNNVYSFTVTLSDNTVNGTFGDMTFKDGVATFTLKAGETTTAHQIPSDLTYKVQEEDYRGIGFKTEYIRQKGTIPRNNTTTSFVKNIRETGDLNLTKINDGGDKNKEFEFIVRIKNKSFSGVYGDMTFYKGEARVKIKGGQTVKAFNLPAETQYEVIEADYINDGYFTNSENATGTIKADAVQRPKFTNVYRTGTLNIAKTSNGNDYHKDREFTFKVTITKPDGTFTKNATYGGINYTTENGNLVTTVKVKEGQSVKLTDIPDTFLYKVEEIEANKDGYVTAVTDNEGVIDNGKTTIVAFTNTRDTFGDLTATKEGIGDGVLASKVFTVRVTLSDRTITGTYGDMEFTDGVAEIKVKAGESKTATKLPNGITYNIEELNANLYKVTYENKTGTIKGNSKISAKVVNEKDLPPIEKKVEGKEHHDLPKRGDTFTYTISTEIPDGAHDFRVTDTLVDELAFGENVKVTIDEKEVETDIRKTGQTLICNLTKEQIEENAGKTLTIEFDAKIDSDDLSKYLIGEDIRVPNKANYLINNSIEKESNTVTVTPPLPEPPIEKFVNEKKHEDLADYDEVFKYKVVTQIPEDALEFEINDTLEPVLEFANENAIVKIDGKETTVNTSFDGQHIKTVFDEETLKSNRCKEVTLEFEAKIKEDADVLQYLNKDNVILIPNKASYTINNSFTTNKVTKESDEVTVTPPTTTPEPVKFVNDKEHEDLKTYEEEFVYKVETIIPRGAYKFVLTDKVVDELYIKEGTVKVEIDGKDFGNDTENTSTEENAVTLEDETPDATSSLTESDIPQKERKVVVDGNLVTVTLDKDDLSKYFNKKLILTFTAGIREDADILKYTDENGKVLIPNKAEYIINDNPNMIKETNTVTVTPPVTEPEIIKYVNDKEHEDLKTKDEIFTYKVVTEVPRGTDEYILSDILVDELEFIKDSAICKIGEDTVDVKVDGQKVYVELSKEQLGKYFNKPIELTFDAKIREGADVSKYMVDGKVKVPNTASYETRTSKKDSNTVTVTPPEDVIIPEDVPEKVITPSNPTKETTPSSPPTGNPSFIPLAIILSAISAGAVIAIVVMGRKKRR